MSAAPAPKRAALGFIFATVLLDIMALGLVLPVLPRLVSGFVGGDPGRAAQMMALFTTTWALMQFVFSPMLGLLSDRFGRRPVILLSNLGLGLDYVVMALAPSLGWLLFGRVFSGLTAASMSAASAYISDVAPPEKRAAGFGLIGAAFGVGFILGPAIGGWLGASDPRLPFWCAAGFSLANALYGLFILPESLPPERRQRQVQWRNANPFGALRLLRSHRELLGLATVNFLGYVAHEVYQPVFALYAEHRYQWGPKMLGLAFVIVGIASVVTAAGLVGAFVSRFGERRAVFAGLSMGALGFALFGWAREGWIFLAAIPINCLWALAGPASQAMMTRRVSNSEQGELQGAIASVRSIAMVVGPGIFGYVYSVFIDGRRAVAVPGAPWYVAALMLIAAMIVARAVLPKHDPVDATSAAVAEAPAGSAG